MIATEILADCQHKRIQVASEARERLLACTDEARLVLIEQYVRLQNGRNFKVRDPANPSHCWFLLNRKLGYAPYLQVGAKRVHKPSDAAQLLLSSGKDEEFLELTRQLRETNEAMLGLMRYARIPADCAPYASQDAVSRMCDSWVRHVGRARRNPRKPKPRRGKSTAPPDLPATFEEMP